MVYLEIKSPKLVAKSAFQNPMHSFFIVEPHDGSPPAEGAILAMMVKAGWWACSGMPRSDKAHPAEGEILSDRGGGDKKADPLIRVSQHGLWEYTTADALL